MNRSTPATWQQFRRSRWIVVGAFMAAAGCQPLQPAPPAGGQSPLFAPPPVRSPPLVDANGQPIWGAPEHETLLGEAPPSVVHAPILDREWAWEQIADTVDDYFHIENERPVQVVGDILTEGRIDTFPQIGATVLEPHRPDSVGWCSRLESTYQTIRRIAVLRVIPDANGYLIEATVEKQLEDLPRPEESTAGAATFRNDGSLRTRRLDDVSRTELSGDWIVLGRDVTLEKQLLSEIHMRLTRTKPPGLFEH